MDVLFSVQFFDENRLRDYLANGQYRGSS